MQEQEVHYGLTNVYFAETEITEIDGRRGRLAHRGYPIQDLVNHPYEYLAYLLLEGSWPTSAQYSAFCEALQPFRELPNDVVDLISRQKDVPADVALQTCLSYIDSAHDFPEYAAVSLGPAIVAVHGALRRGHDPLRPDARLGIASDCLRRLRGRAAGELEAKIINTDFVLHADHGANASAFVARIATSAAAAPLRSLVAAVAVFSGSRHGGAVAGVADMLGRVELEDISAWVRTQVESGARMMGFGHRVYKVQDPRARLFMGAAEELSRATGDRTMLAKVEALVDAMAPYERFGISPNVDLYAAVVYHLLGIRIDEFTAMFAVSRIAGWLAQIREQRSGSNVLIRPRLRYVGPAMPPSDQL